MKTFCIELPISICDGQNGNRIEKNTTAIQKKYPKMKPKVSLQDVWKLVIRVVEMVMAHVKPIVNED